MKKSVSLIFVFILLVLLSVFIYRNQKKKQAEKDRLALLYKNGMNVIYDKDNFFCAEAQFAHWDSVYKNSPAEPEKQVAERFKSVLLLRMGQEKKAIDLLEDLVE